MSIVAVDTITDAAGGNTASINGIPLRQGVIDPENRIINGAFDFWQRGTSGTATAYTAADRWRNDNSGGVVTQSRQSHTVGDKFGSNSPQFYLRQTVSGQSLASHLAVTFQKIEGVRNYSGETITVLGWARRSSGAGNMTVEGAQQFGTGGTPSADVNSISVTTVPLTTSWQPFSVVLTVPSVVGKTIGTDANDAFSILFWTSAGSAYNARSNSLGLQTIGVDLWGIHIKLGVHTADATALYKQPEIGPELARCQRYYTKLGGEAINDILIQGAMSISVSFSATFALPVTMRVRPTGTKVGTWSAFNCVQPQIVRTSTVMLALNTAGTNASLIGSGTGTADTTTYITLDAEL